MRILSYFTEKLRARYVRDKSNRSMDILHRNQFVFLFSRSKRSGEKLGYEMGGRRAGSGGRAKGRSDLQVRRAVDGRMETATEELVKKVRVECF